jgi:hypothetical protein
MAVNPAQRKLAEALGALKILQDKKKSVIKSNELSRINREFLSKRLPSSDCQRMVYAIPTGREYL